MVRNTGSPHGRAQKRQRFEDMQKEFGGHKDLGTAHQGTERQAGDDAAPPDRSLWGEMDPGTPRWSSVRRRSSRLPLQPPRRLDAMANPWIEPSPPASSSREDCTFSRSPASRDLPLNSRIQTPEWLPPVQSTEPLPALTDLLDRRMDSSHQRTPSIPELLPTLHPHAPPSPPASQPPERDFADELLQARLDQMEQMEAMDAEFQAMSERSMINMPSTSRAPPPPPPRQRRRDVGPNGALEELMYELLSSESGPLHQLDSARSRLMFEQLMVVREQILGARDASRLPAHLLYSDRDFNENDYDALLALDDTVPSRKGASQEEIDAIPTWVLRPGGKHTAETRCPICLEDYEGGSVLRVMHCNHVFHLSCLDKWLAHKKVCPICQQPCTQ